MKFEPKHPDYALSPFTGMTRESWIEAGEYLLQGIFGNIPDSDAPVVMPRREWEITYPHSAEALWEQRAEYFEGLARSFLIAAPLIHENPSLEICGHKLRDYYKNQVLRICSAEDPHRAGRYEELQRLSGDRERTFQQTVETAALVICLWLCKPEIWDTYEKKEKDEIAAFLTGYAHGNTVPQNWRLFNMLDLAFLHMEGYPVDEEIMLEHARSIANYYAGDGWYRDGHAFDYYSCWAFNVYAPLWNLWYGYEHAPGLARRFEDNSGRLMETYPDFFDREGFTNMWGRSNIYRNASTAAFAANLMLRRPAVDPGLARRICSGSLLQFFGREDFLYRGVPTLGFYGQFGPLVQGYSCAESPLWLGKAFLCLHLPAEHPFWTARENNGSWERLSYGEVKETVLNGPALCFTNHERNGGTILRTGKVAENSGDRSGMWNYARLFFHTKYPWESTPRPGAPESGSKTALPPDRVEACQYVLYDPASRVPERGNVIFWHGIRDGVLYRRQFFQYEPGKDCGWTHAINLADFPVPWGIFRADRPRLFRKPVTLTLGSCGFPDNGTSVRYAKERDARAIILKGYDALGREKQLAMTVWAGWEELDLLHSQGTNPDSERSLVICATLSGKKRYGYGPGILLSQVITRESHEDFTQEEIFPVESLRCEDSRGPGCYGPVEIRLKSGEKKVIDFEAMEGRLEL